MKAKRRIFWETWFAIALVLTTATQLRWAKLPIGIGEIMLVIWLILVILTIVINKRIILDSFLKLFITFWAAILIALFSGWLVALYQGVFNFKSGFHNIIAYLFICLITLSILTYWDKLQMESIGKYILAFTVLALLPIWIYGQSFTELGPLRIWYGGSRFLGWAADPNQTAILTAPLPFMALYYLKRSNDLKQKSFFLLLLIMATTLGISTDSDSLKVAWIAAIVIYLLLLLFEHGKLTYFKLIKVFLLIAGACLGLYIMFGDKIYAKFNYIYNLGDQGYIRFVLWLNGLKATSNSPLVGFGPGAYSGILEPFSGSECHNTFFDWMTNTGALGFLLLVFLLALIFVRAIANYDNKEVVAVMTVLIVVSFFLYVIRHPIWWFYLLWVLFLTSPRSRKKKSGLMNGLIH